MKRSRINPVSARRQKEWARAYHSEERVRWVKHHPCLVCGRTPSENAHTRSGGMGRKADADTIAPLCHEHHHEYDNHKATFEDTHGLDLKAEAKALDERWTRYREEMG